MTDLFNCEACGEGLDNTDREHEECHKCGAYVEDISQHSPEQLKEWDNNPVEAIKINMIKPFTKHDVAESHQQINVEQKDYNNGK